MLVAAVVARRLGSSGMTPHGSTAAIEPERAATIFAEFAAAEELALEFPADGCTPELT